MSVKIKWKTSDFDVLTIRLPSDFLDHDMGYYHGDFIRWFEKEVGKDEKINLLTIDSMEAKNDDYIFIKMDGLSDEDSFDAGEILYYYLLKYISYVVSKIEYPPEE